MAMGPRPHTDSPGELALVFTGGGARAAYQVGVLRTLVRHVPDLRFPIITGVSAGAINAAFLASQAHALPEAVENLTRLWSGLRAEDIFRADSAFLLRNLVRWGARLASGGSAVAPQVRSLVDTSPLRTLLGRVLDADDGPIPAIARNIEQGILRSVALTTLDYATGQTVTWVQGRNAPTWQRPNRRSIPTQLTTSHVMASAALPLIFPAVSLDGIWHGDGGVRHAAPLSPAIHLGASRILAVSTRCAQACAQPPMRPVRYPPPAQIAGLLTDAVFLDLLDQDALRLQRFNEMIEKVPVEERGDSRLIGLHLLRPSQDLGRLAAHHEIDLPWSFRFLLRGLGSRERPGAEFLSLLMFEPGYLKQLIAIGEDDGERHLEKILALIHRGPTSSGAGATRTRAVARPLRRRGLVARWVSAAGRFLKRPA